jgi:hypothetical protein
LIKRGYYAKFGLAFDIFIIGNKHHHKSQTTAMTRLKIDDRSNLLACFNDPQYSDFRLLIEANKETSQTLHVHKVILASHSGFFKLCFSSHMAESRDNEMLLDTSEDNVSFTEMIRSFYCGEIVVKPQTAIAMLKMAGKYEVPTLESVLINYLCDHINEKNVLQCWTLDIDNVRYKVIMEKAKVYLVNHARALLTSGLHLDLDTSSLYTIFSIIACNDLFDVCIDALEVWIEVDESSRAQYSYAMLKHINKLRKERKFITTRPSQKYHQPITDRGRYRVQLLTPYENY